jgi:hypothetical protein
MRCKEICPYDAINIKIGWKNLYKCKDLDFTLEIKTKSKNFVLFIFKRVNLIIYLKYL